MHRLWPRLIILYLILLAFASIWYIAAAGVIAKSIVEKGTLSPIHLEYQSKFGTANLIDAIKKQYLIWNGGWVLLRPPLIAALGFLLGRTLNEQFRYSTSLMIILHGELIYRSGDLIAGLLIALTKNPDLSMAPGILMAPPDIGPALYNLLSLTNPFLIAETAVVASGYSILLPCSFGRGLQLSLLSIGALPFMKLIFSLWNS
jgi:hypothetical protein